MVAFDVVLDLTRDVDGAEVDAGGGAGEAGLLHQRHVDAPAEDGVEDDLPVAGVDGQEGGGAVD